MSPPAAVTTAVRLPGATTEVALHWARTDVGGATLDRCAGLVDPATRDRARRMLRPADAARVLVGHALLRIAVADRLGGRPADVRLGRHCGRCGSTEHGRPVLLGPDGGGAGEPARVSLSHGGSLVLVGLARDSAIGVDVEPLHGARSPGLRDAGTVLMTPGEVDAAVRAPDPGAAFLRSWTGKEAVAKATGRGLGDDLAGIDVLAAVPFGGPATGWWSVPASNALLAFPAVPGALQRTAERHLAALAVLTDRPDSVGGSSARAAEEQP
jgi:4'-phosphopantetheinyl transferase